MYDVSYPDKPNHLTIMYTHAAVACIIAHAIKMQISTSSGEQISVDFHQHVARNICYPLLKLLSCPELFPGTSNIDFQPLD